jgi:hypothetical protein
LNTSDGDQQASIKVRVVTPAFGGLQSRGAETFFAAVAVVLMEEPK